MLKKSENSIFTSLKKAARCRKCFDRELAKPGVLKNSLMPWIGDSLEGGSLDVALLLSSCPRTQSESVELAGERFRDGKEDLGFLHQEHGRKGSPYSQAFSFLDDIGVKRESAFIASIALCTVAGERAPRQFLRACFELHVSSLLQRVSPRIVILVGSDAVEGFMGPVSSLLQGSKLILVPHFSRIDERKTLMLRDQIGG